MRLLQQLRENLAPLGIAFSSATIVLAIRSLGWLAPSELWAYDLLYRPKDTPCDSPIILVVFNELDVREYGHPIDGQMMSSLLDKLQASQPAAIAVDIFRDIPVEPGHNQLLKRLQADNVIAIERVGEPTIPPPPGAARVGASDGVLDRSGALRRALFALGRPTKPSLGLLAAALYLNDGTATDSWQQLVNRAEPYELAPNDGPYYEADTKGHQLLLRWKECQFVTHSFTDILEEQVTIAPGEIIFIGQTAESIKDSYETPIGTVSGVRYHGNVAAQFLDLDSNTRKPVRLPNELTIILGLCAISLVQTEITFRVYSRQELAIAGFSLLVSLGLLLVIIFSYYISFVTLALWLPIVPALAIVAINLFGCTNYLYFHKLTEKNAQLAEIIDRQIGELIEKQNFVNSAVIIDGIMHEAGIPISDTLAELEELKGYLVGKIDGEPDSSSEEPSAIQDFLAVLEDLASIENNIRLIQRTTQFVRLLDRDYEGEPPPNQFAKVCDTIENLCNYAKKSSINLYRNIEISYSCPKNLFVAVDEGRLTRILTNLIVNSIEELKNIQKDDFQPKILVSANFIPGWCEIQVCDNGPGIPKEIEGKAFSPYVTSKSSDRSRGKGLWIAKLITEAVGGTLTYSKLEPEWCAFLLRLPLYK